MKVLLLAADQGGCGLYRVRLPEAAVKSAYPEIDLRVSDSLDARAEQNSQTGELFVHEILEDADLIVFQRPADIALLKAMRQAKRQGISVAVEVDDDLLALHKDNIAHSVYVNGTPHSPSSYFMQSLEEADFIIGSTPRLVHKYARDGNGYVARNCVPESIKNITPVYERTDEISVLGWTGSVASHPTDLQVTKGSVNEVFMSQRKSGREMSFNVIGQEDRVRGFLRIDNSFEVTGTGWQSLSKYYSSLADGMHAGIVPLEQSVFNSSKSYLKGLEMAALGIPFVATDTPEYEVFSSYGFGKVAPNPSAWRRHLNRIIENPKSSFAHAKENRDRIIREHTYEANAHHWVNAWEQAIDSTKRKARVLT